MEIDGKNPSAGVGRTLGTWLYPKGVGCQGLSSARLVLGSALAGLGDKWGDLQ